MPLPCPASERIILSAAGNRRRNVAGHAMRYLTVRRCTVIFDTVAEQFDDLAAPRYGVRELADRAGVTPRTVHFYIQQGLLEPAGSPGPGARYTEGHANRLRVIRRLQREHLPLAEIRRQLAGLDDPAVATLLEATGRAPRPRNASALDYVRALLNPEAPAGQAAASSASRPFGYASPVVVRRRKRDGGASVQRWGRTRGAARRTLAMGAHRPRARYRAPRPAAVVAAG